MNKLTLALALSMFSLVACTDAPDEAANFVGSYKTVITVTGGSAVTDSLVITEGSTSDLVLTSQALGTSMKATIISDTAFSVDQQQLLVTSEGTSINVTMEGQGTVTAGVFNSSGTVSNTNGATSFTISGKKL